MNSPNPNPCLTVNIGATQVSGIVPARCLRAVLLAFDNAVTKALRFSKLS